MNSTPESLLLTLLYAVSLVAIIGAINARETVRMVISSLLAMLCLAAAVFHTSRTLAFKEVAASMPPPAPEPPPPPPGPDTAGLGASQREAALAQGKAQLRGVAEAIQRMRQNLAAFDLSRVADVSDEEYQRMQMRAQGLASEARNLRDRSVETLGQAQQGLEEPVEALKTALESMATGAHNLERFFKSENDSEERDRMAAYRRSLQNADAALRKAESLLSP